MPTPNEIERPDNTDGPGMPRPPGRPAAKDIDTRVHMSLYPGNIRALEGYEANRDVLAATETAFSGAYKGITEVYETRAKVARNRGWTKEQQLLQVRKFVDTKMGQVLPVFDLARDTLDKQIEALEAEMAAPVTAKVRDFLAGEIRAHCKSLKTEERLGFMQRAINGGDEATVSAILGAPAYLSGHSSEMAGALLRQYRERAMPEKALRLKAMQGAVKLINERAGLVVAEMEKASGATWEEGNALRKTHQAALDALKT